MKQVKAARSLVGPLVVLSAAAFLPAAPAYAQGSENLAKKLANPVADLISAPLQPNYEFPKWNGQ